jgi:hypothetical protein
MSLESIYYIGQTIAVAAILVSLLFVAYQTRQTHRLARMELTRSLLAETRSFADVLSASPEMSDFMFDARIATDPLPPKQFFRLAMYYASWFTAVESAFRIHVQKLMDDGVYDHILVTTKTLDCVNMRAWWELARTSYPIDFAHEIDNALAEWAERQTSTVGEPSID